MSLFLWAILGIANAGIAVYHVDYLRKHFPQPRPKTQEGQPLHAWKTAHIVFGEGFPCFTGLNGQPYQAIDVFRHLGVGHTSLPKHCHCGFYCLKTPQQVLNERMIAGSTWLLEVELYGKVFEGSLGFRGEKQRVLTVFGQCSCGAPATYGAKRSDGPLVPRCSTHVGQFEVLFDLPTLAGMVRTEVRPLTEDVLQQPEEEF